MTFTVSVSNAKAMARAEDCRAYVWQDQLLIEERTLDGEFCDPHAGLQIVDGKVNHFKLCRALGIPCADVQASHVHPAFRLEEAQEERKRGPGPVWYPSGYSDEP